MIVDINNYRAIKFYEKAKMVKLDEYISKDEKKKKLIFVILFFLYFGKIIIKYNKQ